MRPPFRAEHIGSFKRPQHLIDARARFDNGEISKSQLETIEQGEIRHIVVMQQKLGFKAITDGEYPRHMFFEGFFTNLEGMTYVKDPDPNIFMDYIPDVAPYKAAGFKGAETYLCTGKIKRTKPCYVPWFTALAKEVEPEDVKYVKMTICAPEWYHLRHSSKYAYTPEAYTNDTDYFADIAKAYREELDALYDAGCRNIQIDEPLFSFFCSAAMREGMKEVGVDAEALLDTYIKLYHDCLRTRKPDMFVGMHVCRGNFKGSVHFVEGGYDPIAEKVFRMPDIDCFYLEYDTPRAGSFEPLRHLPKDKSVVLGLISSKFPDMESKSDILARLDEAAEIMGDPGKERICLSPQCGFASHIEGNKVTETDVEKKLALVVEIAKAVWGTSEWRHQCAFCKNQSPLAMAMYCGQ